MRRVGGIAGALAAVAAMGFSAEASADIEAFACVPEWAELLRVIGGDKVEITLATSPVENPESARPTPAMIADLQEADLLVCTGAGLEDEWLPSLLQRVQNPRLAVDQPGYFMTSSAVTLMGFAEDSDGDGEEHHDAGNPHIQGDPRNIMKVAGQLARRMSAIDPDNAQLYGDNARAFIRDFGAEVKALEALAEPLRGVNIFVQHISSDYLLAWLGIRIDGTIEEEPLVPPGPAHLAGLIAKVPQDDVKLILYAPFDNPDAAAFVAEKTGVPLVLWPFTVGGTEGSTDFFTHYRDIVARLLDGLNGTTRQ